MGPGEDFLPCAWDAVKQTTDDDKRVWIGSSRTLGEGDSEEGRESEGERERKDEECKREKKWGGVYGIAKSVM